MLGIVVVVLVLSAQFSTADPDTADGERTVAEFLRDAALLRWHSAFPLTDDLGREQGLVTLTRVEAVPPT